MDGFSTFHVNWMGLKLLTRHNWSDREGVVSHARAKYVPQRSRS